MAQNTPVVLTPENVREALKAAVEEKGADYIYTHPSGWRADTGRLPDGTSCQYVHGSEPGCIVGNVLHRLGVPLEAMAPYESRGCGALLRILDVTGALRVEPHGGLRVRRMLTDVQRLQDAGQPWGEAVAKAETRDAWT